MNKGRTITAEYIISLRDRLLDLQEEGTELESPEVLQKDIDLLNSILDTREADRYAQDEEIRDGANKEGLA